MLLTLLQHPTLLLEFRLRDLASGKALTEDAQRLVLPPAIRSTTWSGSTNDSPDNKPDPAAEQEEPEQPGEPHAAHHPAVTHHQSCFSPCSLCCPGLTTIITPIEIALLIDDTNRVWLCRVNGDRQYRAIRGQW